MSIIADIVNPEDIARELQRNGCDCNCDCHGGGAGSSGGSNCNCRCS